MRLPFPRFASGLPLLLALAAPLALAQGPAPTPPAESDRQDFSAAERLLLMSKQLESLKPPTRLKYSFTKRGTLEAPFSDTVALNLARTDKGRCCKASGDFLTAERRMPLPEVDDAEGNPVILYFLEHDIREMNRLTKGSTNYFRKRIRMALFEGATLRDVSASYRGKPVAAKEIVIRPFVDDPNRARFEQFTQKQYVFVLSDAVPGSVVSIRSSAVAAGASTPLIEEELWLDGVDISRSAVKL